MRECTFTEATECKGRSSSAKLRRATKFRHSPSLQWSPESVSLRENEREKSW